MSGTNHVGHVRLQGHKVPFESRWEYFVYVGETIEPYDKMVSTRRLTALEMLSVEAGYREGLTGYRPPTVM